MLSVVNDFGIDKITEITKYDCGEILEDHIQSVLIVMPKKQIYANSTGQSA